MAEILKAYTHPVQDESGAYRARAIGRQAEDGMWEAWIEFVPSHGRHVLVSGVESRQPAREHLAYWAAGLSPVYLEGALNRSRNPLTVRVTAAEKPLSHAPAARRVSVTHVRSPGPDAILDPFEIGSRNLDILRQELTALNRSRLLNLIGAYDLNPAHEDLSWLTDAPLIHFIVVAVDAQLPQRAR
jgi:hypothetical protein